MKRMIKHSDTSLILKMFVHKQQYLYYLRLDICRDLFVIGKWLVDGCQYETYQPKRSFCFWKKRNLVCTLHFPAGCCHLATLSQYYWKDILTLMIYNFSDNWIIILTHFNRSSCIFEEKKFSLRVWLDLHIMPQNNIRTIKMFFFVRLSIQCRK